MSEDATIPIIIGITGKLNLAGKDDAVRRALKECFTLLDRNLPASRKVLLSAFAAGADTIAAEEALGRESWSVIGILPFDPDTYAQDFSTAENAKFRSLTANPRIKWRALMALTNPTTDHPFVADELVRQDRQSNPDRTDHYEQVGFFIAEQSTLLIGVMDAKEQPDRIGGTARILDYRLLGAKETDGAALRVIERSCELHLRLQLDPIEAEPVWLVNLAEVDQMHDEPLRAVQLWNSSSNERIKLEKLSDRIKSLVPWRELDLSKPDPPVIEKSEWQQPSDLTGPLYLAQRIDAFNRLAGKVNAPHRSPIAASGAKDEDASSTLRHVRRAVATHQSGYKRSLSHTIWILAILFVVAISFLEMYFKDIHLCGSEQLPSAWAGVVRVATMPVCYLEEKITSNWPLVAYLLAIFAIIGVYLSARLYFKLQQYSEDYRAVAEALRVQIAWWDAGMVGRQYRADKYLLVATSGSLAIIRRAVRHVIDAALLERAAPASSIGAVVDWIQGKNGQINYFSLRIQERKWQLSVVSILVWALFILSIAFAFSLLDVETHFLIGVVHLIVSVAAILGAAVVFPWSARMPRLMRRYFFPGISALVLFLIGLLISALLYRYLAHTTVHNVIAMLAVITAAAAAAVRYVADSHAWEAELHRYREALVIFKRARDAAGFAKANVALSSKQKSVLFELGQYALEENEFWLRAHRVRPLEPMH